MYARVASATGWTWEYIGQCLTLPRLNALLKYWQSSPPIAESMALYVGIKPAEKPAPTAAQNRERDEFIASMPMRKMELPA